MIDLTENDLVVLSKEDLSLVNFTDYFKDFIRLEKESVLQDIFNYDKNKLALTDMLLVKEYEDILSGKETKVGKGLVEGLIVDDGLTQIMSKDELLSDYVGERVHVETGSPTSTRILEVYKVANREGVDEIKKTLEQDVLGDGRGVEYEVETIVNDYYCIRVDAEHQTYEELVKTADLLGSIGEREFTNPHTLEVENYLEFVNPKEQRKSVDIYIGHDSEVYAFDPKELEHCWDFEDITSEEKNMAIYDMVYLVNNHDNTVPLEADSDGFVEVSNKDVLYFKDVGDAVLASDLHYVEKFDPYETRKWLEVMRSNGAFDGFPEETMDFEEIELDDLRYYFDNWIEKGEKMRFARESTEDFLVHNKGSIVSVDAKGLYEEIRSKDDIDIEAMELAGNYVTYYESLDQLVDEHVEQGWNREEVLFDLEYVDNLDLKDMKKDFILVDKAGVDGGKVFNESHSLGEVVEYMKEDSDMSPFVKGTSANVSRERNHSFFKGRE